MLLLPTVVVSVEAGKATSAEVEFCVAASLILLVSCSLEIEMGGAELVVSVWSLEEELLVPGPTRDSMKNDGFLGLGGDVRAGINGGPVPILVTVLGSLSLLLVPGGFGLLKGLVSLFLLPAGWSLPF